MKADAVLKKIYRQARERRARYEDAHRDERNAAKRKARRDAKRKTR